jgi:hypothetical protein
MDSALKTVLLLFFMYTVSFLFAFGGPAATLNRLSFHYTNVTATWFELQNVNAFKDTPVTRSSIGYTVELALALLLLNTPLAALGGAWLIRIGFMFLFGDAARDGAFGLSGSLRALVAILCIVGFCFSVYKQYYWIDRISERGKYIKQIKDETKLI